MNSLEKMLDDAWELAKSKMHPYVGTEHLLIILLKENKAQAQAFAEHGIELCHLKWKDNISRNHTIPKASRSLSNLVEKLRDRGAWTLNDMSKLLIEDRQSPVSSLTKRASVMIRNTTFNHEDFANNLDYWSSVLEDESYDPLLDEPVTESLLEMNHGIWQKYVNEWDVSKEFCSCGKAWRNAALFCPSCGRKKKVNQPKGKLPDCFLLPVIMTSKELLEAGIKPGPLFGKALKCKTIEEAKSLVELESKPKKKKKKTLDVPQGSVLEWLLSFPFCPSSREGDCLGKASNSEKRRWLDNNSIIINGKKVKATDPMPDFVWELIFFPNGRKVTM